MTSFDAESLIFNSATYNRTAYITATRDLAMKLSHPDDQILDFIDSDNAGFTYSSQLFKRWIELPNG